MLQASHKYCPKNFSQLVTRMLGLLWRPLLVGSAGNGCNQAVPCFLHARVAHLTTRHDQHAQLVRKRLLPLEFLCVLQVLHGLPLVRCRLRTLAFLDV